MEADSGYGEFLRRAGEVERIHQSSDLGNPVRPQAGGIAARPEPLQTLVANAPDHVTL
jgi:hypothetical protein